MRHLLSLFMLALAICMPVHASSGDRDNAFDIDNECYDIYKKARIHRSSSECLKDYEKMLRIARSKNDRKAICLAMSIPMLYYHYHGSEKQFLGAINDLKKVAKQYNLPYYTWWCFSEEISLYVDTDRTLKALNIVQEASKQAQNSPYARFAIYTAFGNIYMARRDEQHAREAFLNAEKIGLQTDEDLNLSYTYISLARITEAKDTAQRRDYLSKAYNFSTNPTDSASALMGLAYLRSNQGEHREFFRLYRKYKDISQREVVAQRKYEKWYKSNEAYRLLLVGRRGEARKMLLTIEDPYLRYQAQADFFMSLHDYRRATAYYDSLVTVLRSSQSNQNIADVAEMNAIYETDRLRHEAENMEDRMTRSLMGTAIIFMVIIIVILSVWMNRHRRSMLKLKALSRELTKAHDEALQASKMKDVFIQNMSHEIRTPLNAVTGFAQLLTLPAECLTDEKRQEFCGYIQTNTNLLTMLIDDILNISDIESGNYKMTIEPYHVNEIVTTAISTIKYRVPDNIEVTFQSEVDDQYCINTDARRVQQVLVNFLTNSIKHTDEGFIRTFVSLKEKDGYLSFIVEDSGAGVPTDKAEDIFQRFEKLNAFKQGTGLGLNICRIISEKLNGSCYLDTSYPTSHPDVTHGARFVFAIPIS